MPAHICAFADMKGGGQGQGHIFPIVATKKMQTHPPHSFLLKFACFGQAKSEWNRHSRIRPKVNLVQLLRIWFCVPFLRSVLSEKNKRAKTEAYLFGDSQTKNIRLYLAS